MLAVQNKLFRNMVVYLIVSFANSTCEHCCSTSSLNLRNPSWILGWLKENDRKCVKGCFFRKLSTRTSTRVTADETADLLGAVITVSNRRRPRGWIEFTCWWWWWWWWRCSSSPPICPSTPCFGMLMDVFVSNSRRLRVSPFFPMTYL